MMRLLADENLDADIVRAVGRRCPRWTLYACRMLGLQAPTMALCSHGLPARVACL